VELTIMRASAAWLIAAAPFWAAFIALLPGSADDPRDAVPARAADGVIRGLAFLEKDAARWRADKQCASCHHGAMTVWAFNEAKLHGYSVEPGVLAETLRWTRQRLEGLDKPRDPRPGWNMVNTIALYLAVMAQHQPGLDTLSNAEQERVADHVSRHLEEDGSVLTPATMSPPRPVNGPPPVFESREVHTLLALLALHPPEQADAREAAAVREARLKAAAWLGTAKPGDDTQAAALRLLVALQARRRREDLRAGIDGLLARQNPDGGWGQLRTLPSDAYATGQALYVLGLAGVDRHRPEIRRGVSFLVMNQREDGSWPMTSRAHPGAKPYTNPVPIGHFGSCWAVIGLARSAPK
jgi:squalene-hopene/tetraprenyl-beta-curcumene cyclase